MRLFGSVLGLLAATVTFSSAKGVAQQLPQVVQGSVSSPAFFVYSEIAKYPLSSIFDNDGPLNYNRNLFLNQVQTTNTPPKRVKTVAAAEKVKRASIDPSMVGYIDDAVIHSEFRIRFDAALDNKTPDRGEFFYAKCGCYAFIQPHTNLAYDPNTPGPGPNIPKDVDFQQLYFYGEYAPYSHLSLFTQIPFRWLQANSFPGTGQAFPNSGGFGDMQFGLRFAPLASSRRYLTLQFKAYTPTGDASEGLGTNHASVEPSLLYYQRLSERFTLEAETGDTHPLSSSAGVPTAGSKGFAGDVFFYGVGPSYRLVSKEQFRLAGIVELVGWNVRSGFVTGPANPSTAGVNIVNIKVGSRMTFASHQSLYVGYGIALTSQNWYREIFRAEYRYAF
ncbi:transporter [Tunturiibacter lichenicola]|uniref:transporter n=1 Tax=Tunturiibacter lichenicola TaxID=2051959 RepID=UPI003D9AD95E